MRSCVVIVTLSSDMNAFPCTACGLCCRKVGLAVETWPLDRGDGVCRYLEEGSNLCGVYEQRPDICRVDRQYESNYKGRFTWDEFVALNVAVCRKLQSGDL